MQPGGPGRGPGVTEVRTGALAQLCSLPVGDLSKAERSQLCAQSLKRPGEWVGWHSLRY